MRFIIGILIGIAAGYAVGSALAKQAEREQVYIDDRAPAARGF